MVDVGGGGIGSLYPWVYGACGAGEEVAGGAGRSSSRQSSRREPGQAPEAGPSRWAWRREEVHTDCRRPFVVQRRR